LPPTLPSIDPSCTLAAEGHAASREVESAAAAVLMMKLRRSMADLLYVIRSA
jgi:hypothetical protein